jgi:copper transport protein
VRRVLSALLAITGFVAVFLAATPSRASAHADLVGTAPGDGEHLDTAPSQVRLRFTEQILLVTDGVMLLDTGGGRLDTPPARADGVADVVLDLPADLTDGVYTVVWRVVSGDSHPIHGAFVFSVGTGSASALGLGGAQAGADAVLSGLFWTSRVLGYVALALFSGGALFLWLCWPAGWSSRRARILMLAGWGTALASAMAALVLQGPYGAGSTVSGVADAALLRGTVASAYGGYVLARLAFLALAGGLLLLAPRLTGRALAGARHAVVVLAALAVPATFGGTGHANAEGVLAMAGTTVHLIAMVAWLGGLALLVSCVLLGPVDASPDGTTRTVLRFSRLAMACVAVLVVTGVYQAWLALGGLAALTGSTYGALLAFKIAIAGVLVTVGAVSRSIVRGGLAHVRSGDAAAPVLAQRIAAMIPGRLAALLPADGKLAALRQGAAERPASNGSAVPGHIEAGAARAGAPSKAVRAATAGKAVRGSVATAPAQRSGKAAAGRPNGRAAPAQSNGRSGRTGGGTRLDAAARMQRRAQRAEEARLGRLHRQLRRSVGIEAVIAAVILGLAAALVATPPGRPDVVPVRLEMPAAFSVDLPLTGVGSVRVVIDPPLVGAARITLEVRDPAGNALAVPEVRASMTLKDRGVGPLPIALENSAPGRYLADAVTIPLAGTWQVRVTVRTTDFDQTDVLTDVTVS